MKSLGYTGYVVSSLTFLALAYTEWQVPGFVSSIFPIYIVLTLAIVCGAGALVVGGERSTVRASYPIAATMGLLLSFIVFDAGGIFGAYRLVLFLIALVLPVLLLKALSDVKD